jgi:hypothetical protein
MSAQIDKPTDIREQMEQFYPFLWRERKDSEKNDTDDHHSSKVLKLDESTHSRCALSVGLFSHLKQDWEDMRQENTMVAEVEYEKEGLGQRASNQKN